jgi:DUF4097 and DUF4098 domain-containing protein YvlB
MQIHSIGRRAGLRAAAVATFALLGLGIPVDAGAAARETETVERTAPIARDGTLTVENFSGNVRISGTDRADVSVHAIRRATRERLDRIKLDVSSDGKNVRVNANRRDRDIRNDENVVETDLTIEVPKGVSLRVTTFSSPVEVVDIVGTNHVLKSFSGRLRFDRVAAPIEGETFSATIAGSLTGGGDSRLQLKTFSGDIEVRLAPDTSGAVEFNTFSGGLDSDVPLAVRSKSGRSLRGHLGTEARDEATLRFKTFSGDVRLVR